MKKNFLTLVLVLIMSISIVGCSNKSKKRQVHNPLKTLTIGVMPDLDSLPLIIAEHNGYFKEEGIPGKNRAF